MQMNYVIEKISKSKDSNDYFSMQNSRLAEFNEKQKMRISQLVRTSEKSGAGKKIIQKQICGEYSPKSKNSHFHKSIH